MRATWFVPAMLSAPLPLMRSASVETRLRTERVPSMMMVGLLAATLMFTSSFTLGRELPAQLAASDQWMPSPWPVQDRATAAARLIFNVVTLYAGIGYWKAPGS